MSWRRGQARGESYARIAADAGTKGRGLIGRRCVLAAAAALLCLLAAGCAGQADLDPRYVSSDRMDKGLVVILPGIEGESQANRNIREGLDRGGVPYALVIYNWGFPVPGFGLLINEADVAANRASAERLALRVARYQREHPQRPVFLIGHSGGGGVAVFALESLAGMPDAQPVDGAFLLSASVSADYPMETALRMTRRGIVNVYNPDDTALLGAGTAIFGNVDGGHGDSAGRTGFVRDLPRLYNVQLTADRPGLAGSHASSTPTGGGALAQT